MRDLVKNIVARRRVSLAPLGVVTTAIVPVAAHAQTASSDPLSALVAGVNFANLETDLVSVGVALAALYIVWVGIHWILRMIRHG